MVQIKKVNIKVNSHSNTNWNNKVNGSLHRSGFKKIFYVLDKNLKDNRFIFVLEMLYKIGLYNQFDDLNLF